VDLNLQDVMDPREIFSGIYGRVGIDFFPYSQAGKKGVGCGLTNVQKLADGDPLGNRTTAEEDFGGSEPAYYAPPTNQSQPQYAPAGYGAVQPPYAPPVQPQHYPQYAGTPPTQPQYAVPTQGYGYPQQPVDPLTGLPV
jgi:hypothetical protein